MVVCFFHLIVFFYCSCCLFCFVFVLCLSCCCVFFSWFMSACAVLTQKPEALMAVFITKEYNEEGVYGLRFFKNGKVANVVIDDYLPIVQRGNNIDTLFAKPKDYKAVWSINQQNNPYIMT